MHKKIRSGQLGWLCRKVTGILVSVDPIHIITLTTPSRFEKLAGLKIGDATGYGSSREELSREPWAPKKHQWDRVGKRQSVLQGKAGWSPEEEANRERKRANLCFTCWEGHEEVALPKGAVLVQEMFRVELIWVWKLFTVMEDRTEDGVNRGALKQHKKSRTWKAGKLDHSIWVPAKVRLCFPV